MSCNGLHHACVCFEDLLVESIEALNALINGIEEHRGTLSVTDKTRLAKFIYAMESARSVIRRSKSF